MQLTKRMECLLAFCLPSAVIADIGCDHGQVAAELARRGIAERVIAADISAPSLDKARRLAEKLHIEDKVTCRLGSGLAVLKKGEANGAIFAGMGTPLIIELLEAEKETARALDFLVLSPNVYPDRLRRYLTENGWLIEKEAMVHEDKFYPVMLARRGQPRPYSEDELLIGRWGDAPPEELKEYLLFWETRYSAILAQLKEHGSADQEVEARATEFTALRRQLFGGEKEE
ncbi:MAG: SAM-dependent methyltransferase [Christensenellaceae bacterium]|nr:SAM-dependent methyltransferase [Christensenellaceae bacterium]